MESNSKGGYFCAPAAEWLPKVWLSKDESVAVHLATREKMRGALAVPSYAAPVRVVRANRKGKA